MGRAKGNLIGNFATLPWPAGVVFGVDRFFAICTSLSRRTHSDPLLDPTCQRFSEPDAARKDVRKS